MRIFTAAHCKLGDLNRHLVDRTKSGVDGLGRSLDGGPAELAEPMDFTHPDFAMKLKATNRDAGGALFFYSTGRGHRWHGPYKFPMRGLKIIPARTGYLVNGKRDCRGFLTASKSNGKEGRPFGARTTDGGLTWKLVSCIGPEPAGFAIVPSTVRLDAAPSTGGQSGNSPGARMGFFELEFGPKTSREEVSRKYQYISQSCRLQERLGGVY